MTKRGYFLIFLISAAVGAPIPWMWGWVGQRVGPTAPVIHELTPGVGITQQIELAQVERVRRMGYGVLVALRPDGEAADQPMAAEIGHEANRWGLVFAYVPVPHGDIPPECAQALKKVLAEQANQRILLYCRTGRRAARTWGLAEAESPGGLDARSILDSIERSGQSADDLADAIRQRVVARAKP
jgi:uncharacterized protein (TIGR01244 family)